MARAALYVALPVAAAILVGCFVVSGGTSEYQQEVIVPEAGPSACSADASLCYDFQCLSAETCGAAGVDGGPAVCCFGLKSLPITLYSACKAGVACEMGSTYQLCSTNEECADGGTCNPHACTVSGGFQVTVQSCGTTCPL